MPALRPKVFEFDVTVGSDRVAASGLGGDALPRKAEWWAEHLVLAGLVRCSLASLDYEARRAGANAVASGRARGTVTKREDGLYGFVEIEATLDVELAPRPEPDALPALVARAERGCFVGNSLTPKPRYRWIVNSKEVS